MRGARRQRERIAVPGRRDRPDRPRASRVYLGFVQGHPVREPAVRAEGGLRERAEHVARARRCGSPASRSARSRRSRRTRTTRDLTVVTMEIKDEALPIHEDAELKIRPRIFLEGNFFVELEPGTLGDAGARRTASTIPVAQTSGPVQLDEVLTSLQSDTREDLQKLLQGYGDALNGEPLPGEDDDQEPIDAGPDGRRVAERLARHRAGRAARHRDRERRRARHRAARPVEARRSARAAVSEALAAQGGAAQGLRHELQPHDGRVRGRGRTTCSTTIHAAAGGARAGRTRRSTT